MVVADCRFQRRTRGRMGNGRFKVRNIQPIGCIRPPLDGMGVDDEETRWCRQNLAQFVQQITQVGKRLGFTGVWPKEKSEMLALLRGSTMQKQVGK